MSKPISIQEAKTHLSRLVEQAAQGREFIIAKAGKPMARLVPLESPYKPKKYDMLKGKIEVPSDFDAPDPEVQALFEGK